MAKHRCDTCDAPLTHEERRSWGTTCDRCERAENDDADALDGDIGIEIPAWDGSE